MKKLLVILMLAAVSVEASSWPWRINFQGKLINRTGVNAGQPYNGLADITFNIYSAASGGVLLWGPELQSGVAVSNGVFSVQLGSVVALSTGPFSRGPAYLSMTLGGEELLPRQQLVMSPYAAAAALLVNDDGAQIASGVAYATFTSAGNLSLPFGITAATASVAGALTASSGTFTAGGPGQYSLQTSSGLNVAAGRLNVGGYLGVGLYYRNYNAGNVAAYRCACPAGTMVLGGGCSDTGSRAVYFSYPSLESTDSAAAVGTAVTDASTAAYSWSCQLANNGTISRCFVICARLAN